MLAMWCVSFKVILVAHLVFVISQGNHAWGIRKGPLCREQKFWPPCGLSDCMSHVPHCWNRSVFLCCHPAQPRDSTLACFWRENGSAPSQVQHTYPICPADASAGHCGKWSVNALVSFPATSVVGVAITGIKAKQKSMLCPWGPPRRFLSWVSIRVEPSSKAKEDHRRNCWATGVIRLFKMPQTTGKRPPRTHSGSHLGIDLIYGISLLLKSGWLNEITYNFRVTTFKSEKGVGERKPERERGSRDRLLPM